MPALELVLRVQRYRALHAEPAIASRTDFFAAAAVVTHALTLLRPSAFVLRLSARLERLNMRRAAAIRAGQLYAGGNIAINTEDFIHIEQSAVQRHLDRLRGLALRHYLLEVVALNRAMVVAPRLPSWLFGDDCLRRALRMARRENGGAVDFASQSCRESVGRQIAAMLRQRGGAHGCEEQSRSQLHGDPLRRRPTPYSVGRLQRP